VVVGSCKRVGHGGQCLCGAGEEQQQKIVVVEPKLSCRNKCAKTTITTVATAAPSRPHQHRRKYDPFATHRKQSQWQQSISAEIRSDLTSLPVCTAHTHTQASCARLSNNAMHQTHLQLRCHGHRAGTKSRPPLRCLERACAKLAISRMCKVGCA
jgi:hypothetical protein